MNDILSGIEDFIDNVRYFITHNAGEIAFVVAVVAAFVGLTAFIVGGVYEHEEFMEQCMVDYKEYECILMWRDSAQNTAIAPLVIHGYQP